MMGKTKTIQQRAGRDGEMLTAAHQTKTQIHLKGTSRPRRQRNKPILVMSWQRLKLAADEGSAKVHVTGWRYLHLLRKKGAEQSPKIHTAMPDP